MFPFGAVMTPIDLYVVPPSPPCRAVIIAAKYLNINVNIIYLDLMKGLCILSNTALCRL